MYFSSRSMTAVKNSCEYVTALYPGRARRSAGRIEGGGEQEPVLDCRMAGQDWGKLRADAAKFRGQPTGGRLRLGQRLQDLLRRVRVQDGTRLSIPRLVEQVPVPQRDRQAQLDHLRVRGAVGPV